MLSHLCQSTASLLQQGTHVIVPKGLVSKSAVCSSSEQSSVVVSQEKITKKKKNPTTQERNLAFLFFFFCWLTCFKSCENKITTFTGSQIVWLRKMCCFNFFLIYFFYNLQFFLKIFPHACRTNHLPSLLRLHAFTGVKHTKKNIIIRVSCTLCEPLQFVHCGISTNLRHRYEIMNVWNPKGGSGWLWFLFFHPFVAILDANDGIINKMPNKSLRSFWSNCNSFPKVNFNQMSKVS